MEDSVEKKNIKDLKCGIYYGDNYEFCNSTTIGQMREVRKGYG